MKALIFDFDGVIVDSETYWKAGEVGLFARIVPGWKAGDVQRMMGRPLTGIYEILVADYKFRLTFEQFFTEFSMLAKDVYAKCAVVDGIRPLLESLKAASVPTAIASSAKRQWINDALRVHDLTGYFTTIVSADDLQFGQGKPMPIPYLLAAKKLNLKPQDCVAIEDAANGVTSAKAAGMKCLAYRWKGNEQDLGGADGVVEDMGVVNVEMLKTI